MTPPQAGTAGERVVLVVDDEEMVRRIAAESLRRLGFTVLECPNGDAAMTLLSDVSRTIDLLFTDIHMPGALSGAALADQARTHRPHLRVLLTSGNARSADLSGRENRYPVLAKPYRRAQLAAAIESALAAPPAR